MQGAFPKGWYLTADHTCDESIHGSPLRGTYIELGKGAATKSWLLFDTDCQKHLTDFTIARLLDTLFAALAQRRDRPRWKRRDGSEVCWQLARQALQKRHYVARFGVAQRDPELHSCHDADRLWKRRHRPIVEIWRGHRDIPQAGNTENIKVVGVLGDISASVVDGLAARCLPVVLNNAKFSVHSAANENPVVAHCTASVDEGIEAAASFGR